MIGKGGKREGAGRKAGSPNKATAVIRELAGKHVEEAVNMLAELINDMGAPHAARISAAKELIERGFGRPGSYATLELEIPLSELSPKEAIATVTDSTAAGAISIEEGQRLVAMIEARIKAVEFSELEQRLSELESKQ